MEKMNEMTPFDLCLWRGGGPQKRQRKVMPIYYNTHQEGQRNSNFTSLSHSSSSELNKH